MANQEYENNLDNIVFATRHALESCKITTHVYNDQNQLINVANDYSNVAVRSQAISPNIKQIQNVRKVCSEENFPYFWCETNKIFYVGIRANNSGLLFLLGPACSDLMNRDDYDTYAKEHGYLPEELYIPYVSASLIVSCSSIFCYLATGISHSQQEIIQINSTIAELYVSQWLAYRLDTAERHRFSYEDELKWEARITDGITQFDEAYIRAFEEDYRVIGKLSGNIDKQQEYAFVSGLTLISRAAIKGGLDPYTSYNLSDVYFQLLSECKTVKEMQLVYFRAENNFCGMIRQHQKDRSQSGTIDKCMLYVEQNIYEKLSVKIIANAIMLSPNYLSSQFIKVTGVTLTKYIHLKRLDRASELLRYSGMRISEVSEKLMFSSQSYFTKLFKEQFHLTPQKYRKKYGVHASKFYI